MYNGRIKNLNTVRIVEIKEHLDDSDLIKNLYLIKRLLTELETELHFCIEINKDDYEYMNTIAYKLKNNLEKIKQILLLQK